MENVFAEFLLNSGLYETREINKENIDQLIELVDGNVKMDCFCNECQEKRIHIGHRINHFWLDEERDSIEGQALADGIKSFQSIYNMESTPSTERHSNDEEWKWINWQIEEAVRIMVFKFTCSLNEEHHLDFVVLANQNRMMKIGQYPSVADLDFPELNSYRKVLSKDDLKEMKRAIGLNAQGIGVGSFVYLRRIIERLVIKAQNNAISAGAINGEQLEGIKVVDRIKKLKGFLPDIFVENATIYGIISKGIHELTEEECLEYFPVLRESIFLILEKWEEERKREASEKRLSASISSIASTIKK